MKFKYTGNAESTTVSGEIFPHGVGIEVTDKLTIAKLQASEKFQAVSDEDEKETEVTEAPKRGRPRK